MAWFGPQGFSMPHSRYDFRPGGEFHYCLRTPTGFEMWGKWAFVDIEAVEQRGIERRRATCTPGGAAGIAAGAGAAVAGGLTKTHWV